MKKLLGVAGEKPNRYFHLPKSMKSTVFGHSYPTAVTVIAGNDGGTWANEKEEGEKRTQEIIS